VTSTANLSGVNIPVLSHVIQETVEQMLLVTGRTQAGVTTVVRLDGADILVEAKVVTRSFSGPSTGRAIITGVAGFTAALAPLPLDMTLPQAKAIEDTLQAVVAGAAAYLDLGRPRIIERTTPEGLAAGRIVVVPDEVATLCRMGSALCTKAFRVLPDV